MPIPGIEFNVQRPPAAAPAITRADVAVFAGLVGRRNAVLPGPVRSALAAAGWREGGSFPVGEARLKALLGVPVAVASWSEFDALFDWRSRQPVAGAEELLPCALGLAVRQFFQQGGVKAWIIRCGDPLPLAESGPGQDDAFRERQLTALAGPIVGIVDAQPILAGFAGRSPAADPLDSATWKGAALIYGIDDAAMLLLPDLPELTAGPARILAPPVEPPGPPEEFRPCAPVVGEETPEPRDARPRYQAPRLTRDGYGTWASALGHTLRMLGRPRGPEHRRDVMIISALPMPVAGLGMPGVSESWPLGILCEAEHVGGGEPSLAPFDPDAIGNARLQLAYPWLATADSRACPEGLQSPEGALAGLIARTALEEGAFRSAAGRTLNAPAQLMPSLAGSDIARGLPGRADWLGDRLCLFAERRGRIELLSDSTAADSRAWRKGGVSRLIATLLRSCRHVGQELVFEPSGPAVWGLVASQVTAILERLRALGAFEGLNAAESYRVTCNRSTMTQADVDAGRIRCEVIVNPASPIERIVVSLTLLEPVPTESREAA